MKTVKLSILSLAILALVGCSTIRPMGELNDNEEAKVSEIINKSFNSVPEPAGPPVVVAVYGFTDKTGQRKPSNTLSLFSTAVTQGAESYLIKKIGRAHV